MNERMPEHYFLVVRCPLENKQKKPDMVIPLGRKPDIGAKPLDVVEPDSPCYRHYSQSDTMIRNRIIEPHNSHSVIVAVEKLENIEREKLAAARIARPLLDKIKPPKKRKGAETRGRFRKYLKPKK